MGTDLIKYVTYYKTKLMKSNHFLRFKLKDFTNHISTSVVIISFLTILSCVDDPASEQSILIKNGTVVNYNRSVEADSWIFEEKIVKVVKDIKVNKNVAA